MPTRLTPALRSRPEKKIISDEPPYLIVLEGPFPSEPVEPIDIEDPPAELVGSYLIG